MISPVRFLRSIQPVPNPSPFRIGIVTTYTPSTPLYKVTFEGEATEVPATLGSSFVYDGARVVCTRVKDRWVITDVLLGGAENIGIGVERFRTSTSDETVTDTTTHQPSTVGVWDNILNGAVYRVAGELAIFSSNTTSNDMSLGWNSPSAAGAWSCLAQNASLVSGTAADSYHCLDEVWTNHFVLGTLTSTATYVHVRGVFRSTADQTVTLEFAEDTAVAGTTSVSIRWANSWLSFTRIA